MNCAELSHLYTNYIPDWSARNVGTIEHINLQRQKSKLALWHGCDMIHNSGKLSMIVTAPYSSHRVSVFDMCIV